MPKISRKNQITLPAELLRAAGLAAGDEVTIEQGEEGSLVVRPVGAGALEEAFGVFDGMYEDGYLERLRSAEGGAWAPPGGSER